MFASTIRTLLSLKDTSNKTRIETRLHKFIDAFFHSRLKDTSNKTRIETMRMADPQRYLFAV